MSNRQSMIDMADRPEGVESAELCRALGIKHSIANVELFELVKHGRLFRGDKLPMLFCRWFKTPEQRDNWNATIGPALSAVAVQDQAARISARHKAKRIAIKQREKATKPKPAPVVIVETTAERMAKQKPDYSRAKLTICPSPAFGMGGRFAVDPGHKGPFSMVGIGRDVDTGKAWGKAA